MLIPINIWRALVRYDAWIEPALIAEWLRLMKFYGERQGRQLEDHVIARAMAWSEPTREVAVARRRALDLLDGERKVFCVWSGRQLTAAALDIGHCLPWAAWPCGDLWNLLPTHRSVNQRESGTGCRRLNDCAMHKRRWRSGGGLAISTRRRQLS